MCIRDRREKDRLWYKEQDAKQAISNIRDYQTIVGKYLGAAIMKGHVSDELQTAYLQEATAFYTEKYPEYATKFDECKAPCWCKIICEVCYPPLSEVCSYPLG